MAKARELLPKLQWWEFYLLHDFWKKFESSKAHKEQCGDMQKESVEGFVVVGCVPPFGTEGARWELYPAGAQDRTERRAKRRRREA